MAKRSQPVEEVVEDEEVDEITEQPIREMVPIGLDPTHLDDFLREQFDTTATGEENGLPSLEWLRKHFQTKSAIIRYLHHNKAPVKVIARHLGLRYQHVRNVLTVELKRGPNENWMAVKPVDDSVKNPKNEDQGGISPSLAKIDQIF